MHESSKGIRSLFMKSVVQIEVGDLARWWPAPQRVHGGATSGVPRTPALSTTWAGRARRANVGRDRARHGS